MITTRAHTTRLAGTAICLVAAIAPLLAVPTAAQVPMDKMARPPFEQAVPLPAPVRPGDGGWQGGNQGGGWQDGNGGQQGGNQGGGWQGDGWQGGNHGGG